jgi:hypothetical protein
VTEKKKYISIQVWKGKIEVSTVCPLQFFSATDSSSMTIPKACIIK